LPCRCNARDRHDPISVIQRIAVAAAVTLTGGYLLLVLLCGALLPLQDFPNHLARALVIADLLFDHGRHFAGLYSFHFLWAPYILSDLVPATLAAAGGPSLAATVLGAALILSLPVAVLLYLDACGLRREHRPIAWLIALYLATDWFFVKGFIAFRLAIPALLIALACLRRVREGFSFGAYLAYVGAIAVGYGLHLSAIAFAAVAVSVTAGVAMVRRRVRWRIELALAAPIALLLVWQVVLSTHLQASPVESSGYVWEGWSQKLGGLGISILRYQARTDFALFALLGVALALPLRGGLARPPSEAALETGLLAGVFLAVYLALPQGYGSIWFVDARAIEMCVLFLVLAALLLAEAASTPPRAIGTVLLAGLLALGNLGALARHFLPDHDFLARYRAVVDALPSGARVLPVYTRAPEGALRPFLHAGELAVIDRHARTPYLFSAEGGYPMVYFHDRLRLPAPDEMWYRMAGSLGGPQVACAYDYLITTAPVEEARLPPGALVKSNEAASLFALSHAGCPPSERAPLPSS